MFDGFKINAIAVIDRFAPEGRAAVNEIKAFIKSHVSSDALDERALQLVGLPPDEIDEKIWHFCHEIIESFEWSGIPADLHTGLMFASADIVRERINELQARGVGSA